MNDWYEKRNVFVSNSGFASGKIEAIASGTSIRCVSPVARSRTESRGRASCLSKRTRCPLKASIPETITPSRHGTSSFHDAFPGLAAGAVTTRKSRQPSFVRM